MPDDPKPPAVPSREPRHHHDPLADRSVFVAPDRAARPHDVGAAAAGSAARPGGSCPFCAGNESRTPPAVLRLPRDEALPWQARIVPNMYPVAVHAPADPGAPGTRRPDRAAHGLHEVVIEAATHERSILGIEPAAWRDVWELCRQRLASIATRQDLTWATVFKNSGPRAGASLEHLHSQLVALDFVPPAVRAELAAAALVADPFGTMLAAAEAGGRLVAETDDLVLVVPPAPRQPFEAWILPRQPDPFFHGTTRPRVDALADLSRDYVARLERLAPGTDFNWWLHSLPFGSHAPSRLVGRWHWHLEILPRMSHFAGFELATGCHITTLAPADAAGLLRGS